MNDESVLDQARQRLRQWVAPTKAAAEVQTQMLNYHPARDAVEDAYAWLTCVLAWEGVASGNFGIGAIGVDDAARVVAQGHNEIFHPRFRSDGHAEMVVMDRWEDTAPATAGTLVTSVEPCPMCLVRLCGSAVRRVLYVAPDLLGGMVHRMESLPPYWVEMARSKVFAQAHCSPELIDVASRIFLLNLEELTERMKAR